jgi:hypothetical protein
MSMVFDDCERVHRAVLRYRTNSATGVNFIDLRIVENGADAGQVTVNLPTGFNAASYLKMGFLSDGKTVSFQYSNDGVTFNRLAPDRVFTVLNFATATTLGALAFNASIVSGTPTVATSAAERVFGSSTPAPGGGATSGVFTDTARTFTVNTSNIIFPLTRTAYEPGTIAALVRKTGTGLGTVCGYSNTSDGTGGLFRAFSVDDSTAGGTPSWPYMSDQNSTVTALRGNTPVPLNAWCVIVWSRDAVGNVTTRVCNLSNPTSPVWAHAENYAINAVAPQADPTNGRFTVGSSTPALSPFGWTGQIAAVAEFDHVLSRAEAEYLVGPNNVMTREIVKALTGEYRLYEFTQTATGTAVTDQIGSKNQTAINDTTVYTAAGTVPYATGIAAPTPPDTVATVPDPVNFRVVNPQIDPAAPTTGKATLAVNATVAATGYTPNASPYVWYSATNSSGSDAAQIGSPTSTATLALTALPLDTLRYYSVRLRDNAGTPNLSNFAPWQPLFIASAAPSLSPVSGFRQARTAGQIKPFWAPAPTDQLVTEYHIWLAQDTGTYPATPQFVGAGTVSGAELTAPAFAGLNDALRYKLRITAARLQ